MIAASGGSKFKALNAMAFVIVAAMLASCATPAQRQYKATSEAWKAGLNQSNQCSNTLIFNPAYAPLAVKMSLVGKTPTLEQEADQTYASPQEATLLLDWHRNHQACRDILLGVAQQQVAFMVQPLSEGYAAYDRIYLTLVQQKITWGEANRELVAARLAENAQIQQAGKSFDAEMNEENRYELAQRQAAAASFQHSIEVQQQLQQQQQLINAINRPQVISPTQTNCYSNGAFTNCTTH